MPIASSLFDFSLPYWDIGDTMAVFNVPLGSPAALAASSYGHGPSLRGANTSDVRLNEQSAQEVEDAI